VNRDVTFWGMNWAPIKTFKNLVGFVKDVAQDPRIPAQDKKILLALIALIASPIDFIPDWIPVFGQLDDLVVLGLILDYFFRVLDSEVLLSHYPWGMKSFARVRRVAHFMAHLAPRAVKDKLWSYTGTPYR
jgi:uncharacterized membrane protein YkvA (DUF1232 family)